MNSRVLWGSAIQTPIGTYKTAVFMDSFVCREAEHRKRYQMKIYCKGISEENIDFIVERRLKAFITTDHAIVTVTDDIRDVLELRSYMAVVEDSTSYTKIMFSPEMIIPDMKYILMDDGEREQHNSIIAEFEHSFFERITDIAEKSGNLTRAEAVRLIWKKFANTETVSYLGIDENELNNIMLRVDKSIEETWVKDEFVKLIIKYSSYIICWEKCYGHNAIYRYTEGHLANRISEDDKGELDTTLPATTVRKWFIELVSGKRNKKIIPQEYYEVFSIDSVRKATINIEKTLYRHCNINYDEIADVYRKFFVTGNRENGDIKATLYEMLLFVNAFCYRKELTKKQDVFKFCMDTSVHVGDITDIINNNLTSSVEIVLMNYSKINQNLQEDEKWADMGLVAIADNIQKYSIPIIITLMKCKGYQENEILLDINGMILSIQNNLNLKERIKMLCEKHTDELLKKDSGYILGTVYSFASSSDEIKKAIGKEEIIETKDGISKRYKNPVKDRAKRFERNYWTQRKQSLKKAKWIEAEAFHDIEVTALLMRYSHLQNYFIRENIRNAISPLIEE